MSKSKVKISLKAKIIFMLMPLICLIIFEIVARLIYPDTRIPPLQGEEIPPLDSAEYADPASEKVLERNYRVVLKAGRMLELPIHERDRDCFYTPVPGSTFSFRKPGSYIVNYKINSLGYRNDEFSVEKDKNKLRIICAGDSSTFGFFVNQHDTYPERLKRLLHNYTIEKNAEVINAGILAYSSYQGSRFIDKYLRNLKPDILVVSYGFNDSYKGILSDPEIELESSKMHRLKKSMRKFATYRLIESVLLPSNDRKLPPGGVPRVSPEEYRLNIEKIIEICREENIHLIFLPISVPLTYMKILKEIASEINCSLIDTEKVLSVHHKKFLEEGIKDYKGIKFGQIAKKGFDPYHHKRYDSKEMVEMRQFNYLFIDYCHPAPVGYQLIAESIYEYLLEQGFFTRTEGIIEKPPDIKTFSTKTGTIPVLTK